MKMLGEKEMYNTIKGNSIYLTSHHASHYSSQISC